MTSQNECIILGFITPNLSNWSISTNDTNSENFANSVILLHDRAVVSIQILALILWLNFGIGLKILSWYRCRNVRLTSSTNCHLQANQPSPLHNWILSRLAIVDATFCLTTLTMTALRLPVYPNPPSELLQVVLPIFYHLLAFSTIWMLICRNWTILLLSSYRYELICRSITTSTNSKFPKLFKKHKTGWLFLTTYFIAGLLAFPRSFEQIPAICGGGRLIFYPGPHIYNTIYRHFYRDILLFLIQTAIPVISTAFLSIAVARVIVKTRKARALRQKKRLLDNVKLNTSNSNQINNVTVNTSNKINSHTDTIILILSFLFFIFETPSFFSKTLQWPLQAANRVYEDMILALLGNLCVSLDSLANIGVYVMACPLFRLQVNVLCQSCKCHGSNHDDNELSRASMTYA